MDLWVVVAAAAAGAGYISRNLLQQIRDKTCPLRRLAQKRTQQSLISEENNDKDLNFLETASSYSDVSQPSGRDGRLLFFVGVASGVISATTQGKNEVEKLKEKLRRTQSLVQDLQDELDMKEMLTVKELGDEGYRDDHPMNELVGYDSSVEASDGNNPENVETRSKIEEELEAELERLEHNLNLDHDFAPSIVQGDLSRTKTTTDSSLPPNYGVSPRELSLRLHELTESRLEARIKELKIALEKCEKQVGTPSIDSNSETESWTSVQSSTSIQEHNTKNNSFHGCDDHKIEHQT